MKDNNLSIDDIHKIREKNYEETKGLSANELIDKSKKAADKVMDEIEKRRQSLNSSLCVNEDTEDYNKR